MLKRLVLLLSLALAAPAAAQPATPAPAGIVHVLLHTSMGDILLALDRQHAPITANNFLHYVDTRRFDGIEFYRAMHTSPTAGLIQGGLRDPRLLYPPIAHEPTTQTGLSHTDGAVSVPRFAPGTAQADFTIMLGDQHYLDANPAATGDNAGFAAFGHVEQGMDVVHRIFDAPTSPTEGEGVMRGQMLSPRIRVLTARRVP